MLWILLNPAFWFALATIAKGIGMMVAVLV